MNVAQVSLELDNFMPQPSKFCDYRQCEPSCPVTLAQLYEPSIHFLLLILRLRFTFATLENSLEKQTVVLSL